MNSDASSSRILSRATGPRVWRYALLGLTGLLIPLNSGCGPADDGLGRIAVLGTVISASGELISGTISFLPEAGTKGPAATASVVEGDFRFDRSNGPVAGKYRVLVVGQLGDAKYKGASSATSQAPHAAATTVDNQLSTAAEWSFDADVSSEYFEFDFEIPAL